jgi:hypothetical protein
MSESYFDTATGAWLQQETARILAAGPLRSQNAKPVQQTEGYQLSEMLPQRMLDAEAEKARLDRIHINEQGAAMIARGAADLPPGKR